MTLHLHHLQYPPLLPKYHPFLRWRRNYLRLLHLLLELDWCNRTNLIGRPMDQDSSHKRTNVWRLRCHCGKWTTSFQCCNQPNWALWQQRPQLLPCVHQHRSSPPRICRNWIHLRRVWIPPMHHMSSWHSCNDSHIGLAMESG